VDLGAPGVDILSTLPGNNYDFYDGTSMACPHVVGVAALLLADDPTLTNGELKWRIMKATDTVGIPTVTGGRLNAYNALTLPPPLVSISLTPTSPTTVSPGETITYTVTLANTSLSDQGILAAVVAVAPNGNELPLISRSLIIGAGQTLSQDFSKVVPPGIVPGAYELIGRVEVPTVSLDEDLVSYNIVP
jgi:subtilisin family serine protease